MKRKEKSATNTNESAENKEKSNNSSKNKKDLTPQEAAAKTALKILTTKCIAAILCSVITALSIFSAFGKLSEAVLSSAPNTFETDEFDFSVSDDIFSQDDNFSENSNADIPASDNGTNHEENTNSADDSNGIKPNEKVESTPLTYSKAELITYYNDCLKKSYAQPKMNATKTEFVDVSVSGIDIGSFNFDVDGIVQGIVDKNTTANNKPQTKSFVNGKAEDGILASKFVLPTNLYEGAVKNIKAVKQDSGYKLLILLNQESCPYTELPPFNSSCAWPLDFTVIDFGWALAIHNCTFDYPGTLLTATIDEQSRVTSVKVEMPLTIADASGKAIGLVNIHVDSIKGKWTCTNKMDF